MKILVKSKDYGFFTAKPVTVQVSYKGQLIACNHDGYFEEALPWQRIAPDDTIHEGYTKAEVCDKCNAWREVGDEEWIDEPSTRL